MVALGVAAVFSLPATWIEESLPAGVPERKEVFGGAEGGGCWFSLSSSSIVKDQFGVLVACWRGFAPTVWDSVLTPKREPPRLSPVCGVLGMSVVGRRGVGGMAVMVDVFVESGERG